MSQVQSLFQTRFHGVVIILPRVAPLLITNLDSHYCSYLSPYATRNVNTFWLTARRNAVIDTVPHSGNNTLTSKIISKKNDEFPWEWVNTVSGIMHAKFQGSAREK